jgi:hypothetical protein
VRDACARRTAHVAAVQRKAQLDLDEGAQDGRVAVACAHEVAQFRRQVKPGRLARREVVDGRQALPLVQSQALHHAARGGDLPLAHMTVRLGNMTHYLERTAEELLAQRTHTLPTRQQVVLVAKQRAQRDAHGTEEGTQRPADKFSGPLHMVYGSKPS